MPSFVCEERLTYGPWRAIERMLARLMQHSGFKDVDIVGGSGDKGADVVGTFRNDRWVVQSKYRGSGGIGSSAVKETLKAMNAYGATIGIVATNRTFTNDAYVHQEELKKIGIDIRLWNGRYLLDYFNKLPVYSCRKKELRLYQSEAVDIVEKNRGQGAGQGLIIMATGLGKSLVASQLISNEFQRNPQQQVLVMAHMKDLVRQLEISCWSQLEKQCSTHLWTDGEKPSYHGGVVFATWQSIFSAIHRNEVTPGQFGLVIVDEAHHAPSNEYRKLLADLQPNFLVGLTATPWRGDDLNLDEIFGQPLFKMDIIDGLQKGYLAEVDYRMLTDGINWDDVSAMSKKGRTIRDLNKLLVMPDRDIAMVDSIVQEMEQMQNPRSLGFCRSIDHAERLRPLFSQRGLKVALIHNKLSREEKFKNLSSFRCGEINMLLSIEMLNEGIDVPDVNLVAFMRVTHSRRIFIQQLGRGLRVTPYKNRVLVMDFVADIRRIAAVREMNRQPQERADASEIEIIRYTNGIVNFNDSRAENFFNQYIADVADIENYEDGSRLKFPDQT